MSFLAEYSFALGLVGAGLFGWSVVRARAGHLKEAIIYGALAMFVGILKLLGQGVLNREASVIVAAFAGNVLLSVAGVSFGNYLFKRSKNKTTN